MTSSGIAVDVNIDFEASRLLIAGNILELRQLAKTLQNARRPFFELRKIRILQRVLVLCARASGTDAYVLCCLQESIDPGNFR